MYPTVLIIIFLLFIAILAFGWFYWQRAKARDAGGATDATANATTDAPATDAAAPSEMAQASSSSDQQ